ncbi:MAG: exodeoxyribonuclease VII small subunit [Chlamydiae bacterium]|nr:exodeoxyribonuclease VII small subunit [Chlamydiota bacterium]
MKKDDLTYEIASNRLEKILEEMAKPQASLEQSLALYEEADKLISFCNKSLSGAESRIEMLIKNRSNDLVLDNKGDPITQDFM